MRIGLISAAVLACGVASAAAASPILNQVNNFSAGATSNWSNGGNAADPVNVSTGGPAGANDSFLRVNANGGGGPGSRLVTYNRGSQWTGNFSAAGVTAVSMDLKNFGSSPLSMRIGLEGPNSTWYVSSQPFTLAADNAWHTATFPLTIAGMTNAGGSATLGSVLGQVSEFRILDNPSVDYHGALISSSFGVDNVRAVPEPASAAVLAAALLPLMGRRRAAV
jgi:hypothetical protein